MTTTTRTSSENLLHCLIDNLRCDQRLPTQSESSYVENLCEDIEKQAWGESIGERNRMLGFASTARKAFSVPFSRDKNSDRSSIFLEEDNKAEGKELLLRGGKRSACSSPASNPSKRRQRQPDRPAPAYSAHIDQDDGAQSDFNPPPLITRNNDIQNSTNGKGGFQTLENPFTTNFLTNGAPIYNQNINSGSGQQNIKVIGGFEVPSSYTPTAAPSEYQVPFEPERYQQRGSGLQSFANSNGIKNKTASDNAPGGHNQTLKGPHGRTHLRTIAPVYNQNVNSGSGQQNIDIKGRMCFQKQSPQEPSRQDPAAGQPSQLPAQNQTVDVRLDQRGDQRLGRRGPEPAYPAGQTLPPSYRSRSPARVAPHSRSGSVVSRSYSPNQYRDRRDSYYDRYCRDRSTSNGDSYGLKYSSDNNSDYSSHCS